MEQRKFNSEKLKFSSAQLPLETHKTISSCPTNNATPILEGANRRNLELKSTIQFSSNDTVSDPLTSNLFKSQQQQQQQQNPKQQQHLFTTASSSPLLNNDSSFSSVATARSNQSLLFQGAQSGLLLHPNELKERNMLRTSSDYQQHNAANSIFTAAGAAQLGAPTSAANNLHQVINSRKMFRFNKTN